jgi:hypothetical protein
MAWDIITMVTKAKTEAENGLLDDRRGVSVLKNIILPVVVVVGASIISTVANSYITTGLMEAQMKVFGATIEKLATVDTKVLENLRQLEHASIRAEERYLNSSGILDKLQASSFTGKDASREFDPIKVRITQCELRINEIDVRLSTVLARINNKGN